MALTKVIIHSKSLSQETCKVYHETFSLHEYFLMSVTVSAAPISTDLISEVKTTVAFDL